MMYGEDLESDNITNFLTKQSARQNQPFPSTSGQIGGQTIDRNDKYSSNHEYISYGDQIVVPLGGQNGGSDPSVGQHAVEAASEDEEETVEFIGKIMSTGNKEGHKSTAIKEQNRRVQYSSRINQMRNPSFADTDSPSNVGNECGINFISKNTNHKTLGIHSQIRRGGGLQK